MIRERQASDTETLVHMIAKDIAWRAEEIAAMLHHATGFVYEKAGQLLGCAIYDLTSFGEEGTAEIHVYTRPDSRNQGIGSELFNKVWGEVLVQKPAAVATTYRADEQKPTDFFSKRGFAPIWGHHYMKHSGEHCPEPAIFARKFTKQDLDMYIQSQSDAYYEVRKGIDLKPYRLTEYQESTMTSWKKWILNDMRENIYMFYHEEEFVGSLILTPHGEVYDVFVDPLQQGKGFGKQLIHFFVNRTLEKGLQPHLITGTHNQPAIRLYEGTGFHIYQTTTTGKRVLV
ncbi:GNAT family N-acetyltransferase [Brevibacillus reuszeri]|uniref:GNAT family N-acetyltransferase n=1 Tax=Brevibacillus reuszeri TaxID=54915 RepID=UPI00289B3F76|nr:GNAT family N-acetyltransferase [Brevibacillus reuszeri]